MTPISLQTPRERTLSWFFTLALAIPLAVGFLPTAQSLGEWLFHALGRTSTPLWRMLFFPTTAYVFYLSIPRPRKRSVTWRPLLVGGVVPVLVALGYGAVLTGRPSFTEALWWYVLLAPLGEEFLFRGWLFGILDRLWPGRMSASFPFSAAVWLSAVAFSLWHAQNFGRESFSFVVFQMAYTFLTGLWFGYLRQESRSVWLGIAFHCAINIASNLL